MSNIEVGEYVRINRDFRIICIGIGKVANKSLDSICVKMSNNDLPISFNVDSISKHSKNIIDLIEVGDYVNGERVAEIYKDREHPIIYLEHWEDYIFEKEIDNVVTKEQFSGMEYKIEAEE